MLTVAKETVLTLNIEKGEYSYDHVISSKFLSYGSPVVNRQVKIFVNVTLKASLTTWELYGNFSLTLSLQPVENKPTDYQIEAVFYGDNALNLAGYAKAPDGTKCAVCTTLQYFGYKQSSASAWLTVEPQATQVTMPTKTPEQLEQEAKDKGWLKTWHEFSWWHPWYRLHIKKAWNIRDLKAP